MGENVTLRYDPKRLKKSVIALVVIFALLVAGTVLQWGVVSDWGNIRVTRVNFVGDGGAQQSGLMFIPEGVSADNPAPGIINYHGRNNSSYNTINWGMEQARRGYVVLNPDLQGTMESVITKDNTTANLCLSAYRYMDALNMVTDISVTGHSMGNVSLHILAGIEEHLPSMKNIVGVGGAFFYGMLGDEFPSETNYCIIEGTKDIFEVQYLGNYETLHKMIRGLSGMGDSFEFGKIYGDPAAGTALQYVEIEGLTHQWELYSTETIATMLEFIDLSSPAPVRMDSRDMIFTTYLFISSICFVLFILFFLALAYCLTSLPLIYEAVNIPLAPSEGKSPKKWAMHIVTDFLVPLALFVPVTRWAVKQSTAFFMSEWLNQIFFWLVAVAIFGAIMITIRSVKKSKERKLTPADFGMGLAEEKFFNGKRLGAALGIGIFVTFVVFTWMDIVMGTTGLNYQVYSMPGQIMRMTPERLVLTLRYLIIMLPVYVVININIATTRRMKTTGNETKDMIRDILVNILLSAGCLTTLWAIQFAGVRWLPQSQIPPFDPTYWDSLAFTWSFPLMMSTCSGGSTFLYRKTGNIWTGVFTTCIVIIAITVLQCCAVPISL